MGLSDTSVRNAKPVADKTIKLSDGEGLQLWVRPSGAKTWALAYRFGGQQKKLTIGRYPAVGLREARRQKDEAKAFLAQGIDPGTRQLLIRQEQEAIRANTFESIADEVVAKKRREGKSERTLVKIKWLLDFAKAALAKRPVREITAPEVLAVLRPIEANGRLETAQRLRAVIGEVMRYAVATGKAERDPTGDLRGALSSPKSTPRPAIIEPKPFGGLLRAIDGHDGMIEVRAALQLLALTFLRPGELRLARWEEFDFINKVWSVPGPRMKMRRPHKVPLAPQALAIIEELRHLNGNGELLFPGARNPFIPISDNALNASIRRLGYTKDQMTAHGFRASASSMLNESGLWNPDAIEAQLAHVDNNSVRRAYHRAEYWDERVRMMSWWADRCDEMRHRN